MGCTLLTQSALAEIFKGLPFKGHDFHKWCQRLDRSGNWSFISLSSLPRDVFIQLMRNAAELTSSSKSYRSQGGICLRSETSLLYSV